MARIRKLETALVDYLGPLVGMAAAEYQAFVTLHVNDNNGIFGKQQVFDDHLAAKAIRRDIDSGVADRAAELQELQDELLQLQEERCPWLWLKNFLQKSSRSP